LLDDQYAQGEQALAGTKDDTPTQLTLRVMRREDHPVHFFDHIDIFAPLSGCTVTDPGKCL